MYCEGEFIYNILIFALKFLKIIIMYCEGGNLFIYNNLIFGFKFFKNFHKIIIIKNKMRV